MNNKVCWSQLHHLAPIAVGKWEVEALSSYLVRLAHAHSLLVSTLVTEEIISHLGRPYLYQNGGKVLHRLSSNWWKQTCGVLNALSSSTCNWVDALAVLTQRDDLPYLTMLAWSKILSSRGLIRWRKAWCPDCYNECLHGNKPVYDPLLWSLKVVNICHIHKRYLLKECPHPECRASQNTIGPDSQIGFCTECNRWLGDAETNCKPVLDNEKLEEQSWIIENVGELLAATPSFIERPEPENLIRAARMYIDESLNGNAKAFATQIGVHHKTVYELRAGRGIPQLGTLLRICWVLQTSPLALVTGESQAAGIVTRSVDRVHVPIVGPKKSAQDFVRQHVQQALQAILSANEIPPPSMRIVAERIGFHQSFLKKHFPDECSEISMRYEDHVERQKQIRRTKNLEMVRNAVMNLHDQGLYPSHKRLRATIGGALRDPDAREIRRKILCELGYKPD